MEGSVLRCLLWRLKALRSECGLTQENFAELADMSYKYYQAVEAGRKRELRIFTHKRLAKGHGIPVWKLISPVSADVRGDGGKTKP